MKIVEKIAKKANDIYGAELPVIAFLGDSVTHGCFEVAMKDPQTCEPVFDQDCGYNFYVTEIFKTLFPQAPICMINAGISGGNAANGASRLERDVLRFQPDLTVVCFGLNDSAGGLEKLQEYKDSLRTIFNKLKASGSEVIYMTPNMMNTYVSYKITDPDLIKTAELTGYLQNEGIFKTFLEEGKKVASECGVTICDAYRKWEVLQENGVDTTALLSNHINHPTREMNWLFAYSLVETMMQ